MLDSLDYRECLKKADAYKAIGQTRIYLYDGSVFPWEHVTSVKPGGSHRMDISTSVQMTAQVDGLEFCWSWHIEDRSANGKGHYEINVGACREVLSKLPESARTEMREYFAECAGKVQEKGQEWQRYADRQKRDADILHALATRV
jgi:hypothetical protein